MSSPLLMMLDKRILREIALRLISSPLDYHRFRRCCSSLYNMLEQYEDLVFEKKLLPLNSHSITLYLKRLETILNRSHPLIPKIKAQRVTREILNQLVVTVRRNSINPVLIDSDKKDGDDAVETLRSRRMVRLQSMVKSKDGEREIMSWRMDFFFLVTSGICITPTSATFIVRHFKEKAKTNSILQQPPTTIMFFRPSLHFQKNCDSSEILMQIDDRYLHRLFRWVPTRAGTLTITMRTEFDLMKIQQPKESKDTQQQQQQKQLQRDLSEEDIKILRSVIGCYRTVEKPKEQTRLLSSIAKEKQKISNRKRKRLD